MIIVPYDISIAQANSGQSHKRVLTQIRKYLNANVARESYRPPSSGTMGFFSDIVAGRPHWGMIDDDYLLATVITVEPSEHETYITLRFLHTG